MEFPSIYIDHITDNLPKPTIPIIFIEPTSKQLIQVHKKLCYNAVSVTSNLISIFHDHLELFMSHENYLSQIYHTFIEMHNLLNYPLIRHHPYLQVFYKVLQIHKKYTNTGRSVNLKIKYAVEPAYVEKLRN